MMKKLTMVIASLLVVLPVVHADVYDANFDSQVKELAAKAQEVGKDVNVQSIGIEDLESARQRIEG